MFDHKDVHELAALIGAIDKISGGFSDCCENSVNSSSGNVTSPGSKNAVNVGGFLTAPTATNDSRPVIDSSSDDSSVPNLVLKNITNLQACVSRIQKNDKSNQNTNNPDSSIRLPKLMSVFASRACR